MSVQERVISISLLEKIKKNPKYAKEIGLQVVEAGKIRGGICDERPKKRNR